MRYSGATCILYYRYKSIYIYIHIYSNYICVYAYVYNRCCTAFGKSHLFESHLTAVELLNVVSHMPETVSINTYTHIKCRLECIMTHMYNMNMHTHLDRAEWPNACRCQMATFQHVNFH